MDTELVLFRKTRFVLILDLFLVHVFATDMMLRGVHQANN